MKVLASEDGTDVSVNGTIVSTLNAGQFRTLEFSATEVASIITSKPSAVTVFAKSQECNDPAQLNFGNGDPFMITYSPNNQRLTNLTFNALQLPSIDQHFITVIVPTQSIGATRYDGGPVVANLFQPVPGTEFSYMRLQISQGVHRLENPDGFIAYVYGFGFIESYGYSAGARLENLNFEVEPLYDFEVAGDRVACLNNEALWEIFPENELFTYFLWDFGDGSTQKEGKAINHTYTEEGLFEITVIAALSPDSCDEQQTITFEVRVESTTGTLEGPQSVCPEVEELTYRFNGSTDLLKTEFVVEGGTITDLDESAGTVTIQWGEANPAAKIIATPYNLQGCPGDEVELLVVINQVIESSIPQGDTQICFDLNRTDTYTIQNPSPNRIFTWFITGGEFVGGNEGSSVEVLWTAAGASGEIWYTEISTIDELCEGESPKLNVSINPLLEAQVQVIRMVSCFGGTDGFVEVFTTGGTAPYTYQWSHDPSLNQPRAEGLIAGFYQVKILDNVGCDVEILDIEITEPDLLEIISLSTEPTSCFGKDDGVANISIQGGTLPYSIDFRGGQFQGSALILTGLEGRSYSLEVSDANGCTIPVIFEVTSPLPLEVDVRILRPACPGESNGQLIAEPTGEFRPFIFSWDFDNSGEVILSDIPRGTYTVSVRNQSGCVSVGKADMVEARPLVRMPTGFKLEEGEFKAVSNCTLNFDLKIINRWGQLVYMGNEGWNGLIDGEPAPLGSYSYIFVYQYPFEGGMVQEEIRGIVTLIR